MLFLLKDLTINSVERHVLRDGEKLKLPNLSFDVLLALLEAAPETVSLPQLSETVWRGVHVGDETVSQRITLLRRALGDDPKAPRYIRTVRGSGYAIVGAIERADYVPGQKARHPGGWIRSRASLAAGLSLAVAATLGGLLALGGNAPEETHGSLQTAERGDTSLLIERARQQLNLHQAQETDRAVSLMRAALEQDPTSFDARLMLSLALSTQATKFTGDGPEEAEAERLARALIEERSDNSSAWSALGYTLSAQGRSDEALAAYRQAFELDPQNVSALSSAAHILILRGDLQQGLLLEVQARQAGGTSRYSEIQIFQALNLINHPAASLWRERALALNPGQAVVLREVASADLHEGRPQAALDLLSEYEAGDDSSPQLLVTRGRALIALGQIDDARQVLEAAGWRGQYGLAALSASDGDPSLAEEWFTAEVRLSHAADPSPDLKIQLAEVSAALGKEDDAIELVSQAVSLGWRDAQMLKQSPFLGDLMASDRGLMIEDRIARELSAQAGLIENTRALDVLLE